VLRLYEPLPVPGRRVLVRRRVHDRCAPDPRLGGARRPEPPPACRPREGRRPQPARRHVRARVRPERLVLRVGGRRPPRPRRQALIESHWGESTPLSLGVEEEVMILDAETLEPAPAVATLLAEVEGAGLPGRLKTELHASVVELNTDVCADAGAALASVRALRADADAAARANGLRIAAAGAHPTAPPESLEIVQEDRYREMLERLGPTARHQGVNGLHVHVGMPDGDASMRVLETVLPWLP